MIWKQTEAFIQPGIQPPEKVKASVRLFGTTGWEPLQATGATVQ